MRLLLPVCVSLILAGLSGAAPCMAQSEPGSGGASQAAGPSVGAVVIDTVARRILHDYYQRNAAAWVVVHPDDQDKDGNAGNNKKQKKNKQKHKDIPPGIAKKGTLPPGIYKQLVRNGQIPPEVHYHALPPDLIVQLPPIASAYRYVIADDRVMLIQAATNVIMDVLQVPGI
jgi:hypothetical protein